MKSTQDTVRDDLRTAFNDPVDPPPPSARPAALPVPPFITSTPLLNALYDIIARRSDPLSALVPVLSPTVEWDTPLVTLSTPTQAASFLSSFLRFSIDPALCIHTATVPSSDELDFSWTLSFIYPLPWRPRVAISGKTVVSLKDGLAEEIADTWSVPPLSLVVQTMPTLADFAWLWASPHAESDRGSRRLLRKGNRFSVVEMAGRPEFRIVKELPVEEQCGIWTTSALPPEAFEGDLRRKELYSTVTPISIREIADNTFEWAALVPGMLFGSSDVLALAPFPSNARITEMPERILAVTRFTGFATKDVVKERIQRLTESLVKEGILKSADDITRERVWVRFYDAKVGFNSAGLLSMVMYAATRGIPRLNEIAIELPDYHAGE